MIKKILKRNQYIYFVLKKVNDISKKLVMCCIKVFCTQLEPKVVFSSFKGKSYSDSPKAISEKLHEKYPEIEIVWLFNDVEEKKKMVPSYVRCVQNRSLKGKKELYTAKCWVDNFPKNSYEIKTNKQLYIQTFHGDRAIKKVAFDKVNSHGKVIEMLETKRCDLYLAGSDMGEQVAKSAFKYSGKILKAGLPRNDILLNWNIKQKEEIRNRIFEGGGYIKFCCMLLLFETCIKERIKMFQS